MTSEAETPDAKQSALPGMEIGTEQAWIITFEEHGLTYKVLVEAMTKKEAIETFEEEFDLYEIGLEDDEFDWDFETVWARSQEIAEKIALERKPRDTDGREYMRTYQVSNLGNTAKVTSIDPFDAVDGWEVRRAKRESEVEP